MGNIRAQTNLDDLTSSVQARVRKRRVRQRRGLDDRSRRSIKKGDRNIRGDSQDLQPPSQKGAEAHETRRMQLGSFSIAVCPARPLPRVQEVVYACRLYI